MDIRSSFIVVLLFYHELDFFATVERFSRFLSLRICLFCTLQPF